MSLEKDLTRTDVLPFALMDTLCTSRLLSVLVHILGRKAVFVLVTRSSQSV